MIGWLVNSPLVQGQRGQDVMLVLQIPPHSALHLGMKQ